MKYCYLCENYTDLFHFEFWDSEGPWLTTCIRRSRYVCKECLLKIKKPFIKLEDLDLDEIVPDYYKIFGKIKHPFFTEE